MGISDAFKAHLANGQTHVCRCWAVTRKDGVVLGFTDHDLALQFDGIDFSPSSGMTARALEQTTGLAVDNTEALGVLSASAISEADIQAGRYDGAEVRSWLVNWSDVAQRLLEFRGSIGEITRSGGAFQAELRGLTEALNQPQGRIFQKSCSAVLGDVACRFDLSQSGYATQVPVEQLQGGKFLTLDLSGFADRWFERGTVKIQSGAAVGLVAIVKNDRTENGQRTLELWEQIRAEILPGDMVLVEAGCDRRVETCRLKFDNLINFQGFPAIPGEDWLMSVPRSGDVNDGGSLRG